jgi:ADP-ribosylglycohydrolase
MYGAILGDIIGSPYEFDRGNKSKDFPLFSKDSTITDDTVMTIAVAEAFMGAPDNEVIIKQRLIDAMHKYGNAFPDAGYGGRFAMWLFLDGTAPYNSFGNGSAMRVSCVAWLYDDLDTVRRMARLSAEVTHNHPEGVKGARAVTAAIFMARQGASILEIRDHIHETYYPLDFTLREIRPSYTFDVSCQGSVPQAIVAFLESKNFEDAIRNAISLGGDSDTIAAIAGSIAEAYYGVPQFMRRKVVNWLDSALWNVVEAFEAHFPPKVG